KDHTDRIIAVWDDVDLEGTRHLDSLLLEAVFRAFNLKLKVDELEKVFRWIDTDNREAITADQFIAWMVESVETLEQRDMQKRMFDAIDRTVRGELQLSQSLQEEEEKERQKLNRLQNDTTSPRNKGQTEVSKSEAPVTSRFRPATTATTNTSSNINHTPTSTKVLEEWNKKEEMETVEEFDKTRSDKHDTERKEAADDVKHAIDTTLAEFSDNEDDNDVVGELPSFDKTATKPVEENQAINLAVKLE
ncbi:hypothetical protein RFI_17862, partial [Reticulomyxa filosa]